MMLSKTNMSLTRRGLLLATIVMSFFLICGSPFANATTISQIRDQKQELEARINANQKQLEELGHQANSLKNKIASLSIQIQQLQNKIDLTGRQLDELRVELAQTRKELNRQKGILRDALRESYIAGDIRTLELLVNSEGFSDFFDQSEYLNRIRSTIQDSATKISELEKKLTAQEQQQTQLLADLKNQKAQLGSTRHEQKELLRYTKGQESRYQKKVASDKQAVNRLQAILAASTRRVIAGGTGGYPYPDSCGNPYPNPWVAGYCPAHWSYIDRQCTSWAYWRRINMGLDAEMYWHNARDWKTNAERDGYRVDKTPTVGAIGVKYNGGYPANHVYIVEQVLGPNLVIASQYNAQNSATGNQWGRYSLVEYTTTDDWFIHERIR